MAGREKRKKMSVKGLPLCLWLWLWKMRKKMAGWWGTVRFWFGCVWFSFSQGEGTNFGWLGEEDGGKQCGAGSEKKVPAGGEGENSIGAGDRGSLPTALGTRRKMAPTSSSFFFAKLGMRRNSRFQCEEGPLLSAGNQEKQTMGGG